MIRKRMYIFSIKNFNCLFIGKPAKLSSNYIEKSVASSFKAFKAVDGIYEVIIERDSMAHSEKEYRPWWRVDLVDVYCVWAVNILNRGISELCDYSNSMFC